MFIIVCWVWIIFKHSINVNDIKKMFSINSKMYRYKIEKLMII